MNLKNIMLRSQTQKSICISYDFIYVKFLEKVNL